MGWTVDNNAIIPVVKFNGECRNYAKHKFCPYWYAKHTDDKQKRVIGYKCRLFDQDKEGYSSLPECNAQYGLTYDGKP